METEVRGPTSEVRDLRCVRWTRATVSGREVSGIQRQISGLSRLEPVMCIEKRFAFSASAVPNIVILSGAGKHGRSRRTSNITGSRAELRPYLLPTFAPAGYWRSFDSAPPPFPPSLAQDDKKLG